MPRAPHHCSCIDCLFSLPQQHSLMLNHTILSLLITAKKSHRRLHVCATLNGNSPSVVLKYDSILIKACRDFQIHLIVPHLMRIYSLRSHSMSPPAQIRVRGRKPLSFFPQLCFFVVECNGVRQINVQPSSFASCSRRPTSTSSGSSDIGSLVCRSASSDTMSDVKV